MKRVEKSCSVGSYAVNFSGIISDKEGMKRSLLLIINILILNFLSSCATSRENRRTLSQEISCVDVVRDIAEGARGWHRTDRFVGLELSKFDQAIHVTQKFYGKPGIINRISKLKNLDFDGVKYMLDDNPIPFVLGPDGKRYIIDRHHFARAFYDYRDELQKKFGKDFYKLNMRFQEVEVFGDVPSQKMDFESFEKMMTDLKLVYLDKPNMKMSDLPVGIGELEEDYYRGLAWIVVKSGAIGKTDIPFQEFYWAAFFKKNLDFKNEAFTLKKIKKAIKLSLSDKAASLPGYREGKSLSKKNAVERLEDRGIFALLPNL